jgi:putative transposase
MTAAALPQGEPTIARMCSLAAISRAGYYRHWCALAPRQEETGLRDAIQRLTLADRHCGYRRITAQLHREGFAVDHNQMGWLSLSRLPG